MRGLALAALAAFVFSIPTENGVTIGGAASLSRILGAVTFGLTVAALFQSGRLRMRTPSLFIAAVGLFVLWNISSYFWSIEPSASFAMIARYGQLAVLAWMVYELGRTPRERNVLMQAYVLGCYLLIGIAVVSYLSSPDPQFRDLGRFNPNAFTITSALGIPMAWALFLSRRSPLLDAVNALYPAVAVLAVVVGASRGGLLTALVALVAIPLTLRHLAAWKRAVLLGVLVLGTWTAFEQLPRAFPVLQANVERLAATSQEVGEGDFTGRTDIWRAGLEVFASSASAGAVGVGSGGFRYAVEPLLGRVRAPHNGYLSVLVGSGLIGLMLFLVMHVLALVSAAASGDRRAVYLVLLAALVVSLLPANAEDAKHTWFVLALLAALRPLVPATRATGG